MNYKIPPLPTLVLTTRQICDLELIINKGFAPLENFMDAENYLSVIERGRLINDHLFSIPIILDISQEFLNKIKDQEQILLTDPTDLPLAIFSIRGVFTLDKLHEANLIYGTDDTNHYGVNYLFKHTHDQAIYGELKILNQPAHHDFSQYRRSPDFLKSYFKQNNINKIIGFQTRNAIHQAHYALTRYAMDLTGAHLLLQPSVGLTQPDDVSAFTRMLCYKKIIEEYPANSCTLNFLPLAMRMAGPKEALLHAIIRKNYGCTHFIIGRDHAGPSAKNQQGENFYDPYAAQELVQSHAAELNLEIVGLPEMVYSLKNQKYILTDQRDKNESIANLSGTEFRELLSQQKDIPNWFSFPEIINILRREYLPKDKLGFTIFFTGLPSAGKSTLAQVLYYKLLELLGRPVTLLDGDEVRKNLSKGLGFSEQDRITNLLRIGYVAAEIVKHRGICICAPIAPYQKVRAQIRELVAKQGGFFEIYLSTDITVCEARDVKGLYKQARKGLLSDFTGVNAPYEIPTNPDVIIDTGVENIDDEIAKILTVIKKAGYIK